MSLNSRHLENRRLLRRGAHISLLFLLAAGLSSCALFHRRGERGKSARTSEPPQPAAPQFIGTVVLVNEDARFVLIDTGMQPTPADGTALKTFTEATESGVVNVGRVTRRPFVAADIAQGAPRKGDRVFQ